MHFPRVTWRTWAVGICAAAAYAISGFTFSGDSFVEAWVYRCGLTAASAVPVAFIGIYTWFGLAPGPYRARWWSNPLGSALVVAAAALIPIAWPLTWVFWMDGGRLTNTWLAWFEVSGPVLAALAWARVCFIWLSVRASEEAAGRARGESD